MIAVLLGASFGTIVMAVALDDILLTLIGTIIALAAGAWWESRRS